MAISKGSRVSDDASGYDRLLSEFKALRDKVEVFQGSLSATNDRVQACEAKGAALIDGLTAVKADAGLTAPLYKANMNNILAATQRASIQHYNMHSFACTC